MQFDLGLQGLVILVGISLVFGIAAQLLLGKRADTRWLWLIAATGWFVGGLITSEVIFGSATEAELQPNIDGLSLDESLLGGLIVGVTVVVITLLVQGRRSHRPTSPA